MLEMRPECERCKTPLPPTSTDALICSFECTFCSACGQQLNHRCLNCAGRLVARPTRATSG